ncbi:hypothetical protein [Vallitalea okinawensis]|uniref:hypothetical protein n=1 Tax=Vallitalea okinawensis TaxID=2078660 RepID=UPI000CFD93F7|nr:hypothetical protein [Vallitalea okinawensis]
MTEEVLCCAIELEKMDVIIEELDELSHLTTSFKETVDRENEKLDLTFLKTIVSAVNEIGENIHRLHEDSKQVKISLRSYKNDNTRGKE